MAGQKVLHHVFITRLRDSSRKQVLNRIKGKAIHRMTIVPNIAVTYISHVAADPTRSNGNLEKESIIACELPVWYELVNSIMQPFCPVPDEVSVADARSFVKTELLAVSVLKGGKFSLANIF